MRNVVPNISKDPLSATGTLVQLGDLLDWHVRDANHPRHLPLPSLVGQYAGHAKNWLRQACL